MGNYSIKELEQLSGVKSHTIRIWEQRYALLKPHRTKTNIRYYDDQQLKKLLNISILNNHGYKISKISELTSDQIHDALSEILSKDPAAGYEEKIKGLIVAMIEVNEGMFSRVIDDVQQQAGFRETIRQVIYPFLYKVGIMWGMDEISPPQEHFISNLIRHRIIAEISKLPLSNKGEKYILFLPEDELHDIGLLIAQYELRSQGKRVIYLGQDTPTDGIRTICDKIEADVLMTFFIKTVPVAYIQGYLDRLSGLFRKQKILVAGREELLGEIKFPANIFWLRSPEDL